MPGDELPIGGRLQRVILDVVFGGSIRVQNIPVRPRKQNRTKVAADNQRTRFAKAAG